MNTELTEQELSDIESEKHWRIIARQDAVQDRADEHTMQLVDNVTAISGFFGVKLDTTSFYVQSCNEMRMHFHDAFRRAYVRELMTHGFTEQEAWEETSRIYN